MAGGMKEIFSILAVRQTGFTILLQLYTIRHLEGILCLESYDRICSQKHTGKWEVSSAWYKALTRSLEGWVATIPKLKTN